MTNPLGFDALQGILHRQIASLPDPRHKGPNTRYTMQDAALGAFGIFFTQSPSFWPCTCSLRVIRLPLSGAVRMMFTRQS